MAALHKIESGKGNAEEISGDNAKEGDGFEIESGRGVFGNDSERARQYHERASEIVAIAATIKNYRARDTLLRLAISYDQMAEKIEQHLPKG